jgi:hypothetical protein
MMNDYDFKSLEISIRKDFRKMAIEYIDKMPSEIFVVMMLGILTECIFSLCQSKKDAIYLIKTTIDECVRQFNEQG